MQIIYRSYIHKCLIFRKYMTRLQLLFFNISNALEKRFVSINKITEIQLPCLRKASQCKSGSTKIASITVLLELKRRKKSHKPLSFCITMRYQGKLQNQCLPFGKVEVLNIYMHIIGLIFRIQSLKGNLISNQYLKPGSIDQ